MQIERHPQPPESCSVEATPPAAGRRPRPQIETAHRRLRQSAERLVRLLELHAPEPLLANEVALLLGRGLAALPALGELLGRQMGERARVQAGICARCGEGDLALPDRRLCAECAAEEDAEQQRAEQRAGEELGPLAQALLDGVEQALVEHLAEEERWQAGEEVGQ